MHQGVGIAVPGEPVVPGKYFLVRLVGGRAASPLPRLEPRTEEHGEAGHNPLAEELHRGGLLARGSRDRLQRLQHLPVLRVEQRALEAEAVPPAAEGPPPQGAAPAPPPPPAAPARAPRRAARPRSGGCPPGGSSSPTRGCRPRPAGPGCGSRRGPPPPPPPRPPA